ncbi:MAG TPA: two-component system response regulator [Burkholderiaceae bacterium]|nr:two-component system response regulator [Burkholderiaceae bacterium]
MTDRFNAPVNGTILVVDDNPENLTVLGELLQPSYRVLAATSGPRALQLAVARPRPDLILLDVMMPEMDGYETLERLAADPRSRAIPVIFVTAMNATESEEWGLGLGAVDFIAKPYKPTIVLARVRTHMELKHARDRLQDQNAYLEAEVAHRMHENTLAQEASIHALARLAETRDPETGNHIRRTQEYVRVLATRLQTHRRFAAHLNARAIELLCKSAPLHDIGKVGIPDHILLKPGKLTPQEWTIMKTHARLGADAIERAERDVAQPLEFLAIAKEIALHHHEKWDGSGYPDGLAGDAIPFPARLMALADVFDAVISRRVYKEPMPFERARSIITTGSGRHFDPDVVTAFEAEFDRFRAIAERLDNSADEAPGRPDPPLPDHRG